MRNRKRALLGAVFATGLFFAGAGSAAAETLAEAIALALTTNPTLLVQRSNLRDADERYFQAERGLGPTIGVSASVGGDFRNDLTEGSGSSSGADARASIDVRQRVYTGGQLTAGLKAEEASLLSARETLRQGEMTTILNVVQVYTDVRRLEAQLQISKDNVAVLQRQFEEAQARFEVGQQTRTDVAQSESRMAGARSQLTAAENNLANARERYRTVVGKMPEQLQDEPEIRQAMPPSQAQAFLVAEQNSPNLRRAYLDERASAAAVAQRRGERWPQVNFSTNLGSSYVNSQGIGGGFGDPSAAVTTGLAVTIPLYTGLVTQSRIRVAEEGNRRANVQIEGQRRALNETVTQQYNAVVANRAVIASQNEAVRAAQLAYEGTREEQQVGLRATLDVLNAEQDLRTAQQQLINARFNEYTSMVQLLNAMGVLTPEMFNAQVEKYDPKAHFDEINRFNFPWENLIRSIDRIAAPPIPERQPLPGENVPTFEPVR